ncbi:lysosomal Pro-X carboxypeptidase-like [Phalaenopsis equestris]|uniref:lysosomal Pro-X carboxypeptidase-like n=1 Tax=Phalaenopsis equestris TaxID=78828 RepID=UPI0009E59755|nr:lysosomal Pro-X carboxypeptidase-like [Phalaenopsis equestris]
MKKALQALLFFLVMLASAKALRPSSSSMIGLQKRRSSHWSYMNSMRSKKDGFIPPDFELRTYSQTLDHFNFGPERYITFQQRYAINFKHWGGASSNSPIFLYTGDEAGLDGDLVAGFPVDIAPRFKALLVFVEHRYYGKSYPFGSKEEAYRNSSTLQYFSSEQALADYAEFIRDLKKSLSAENSPVIAMGGSYGGMLAAWFRLKYPHVVIGALASSAPILYFDDITPQNGYYSVVTKDFRETSKSCYETIKTSWSEIDKVAAQKDGLSSLSQMFNTCSRMNNSEDLKNGLEGLFSASAQYDDPKMKPVSRICAGIDKEPNGTSVLQRIVSGIKAVYGGSKCFDIAGTDEDLISGWSWQVCTEMVMPIGISNNSTMFEPSPFDLRTLSSICKQLFNVNPRPHWITTEFGGHKIKDVLKRFGSNIIFSNGLRDPYSSGGVLQKISNSIVALVTAKGSHCLDILGSNDADPEWLISQRNAEVKILENWIEEYNAIYKINK